MDQGKMATGDMSSRVQPVETNVSYPIVWVGKLLPLYSTHSGLRGTQKWTLKAWHHCASCYSVLAGASGSKVIDILKDTAGCIKLEGGPQLAQTPDFGHRWIRLFSEKCLYLYSINYSMYFNGEAHMDALPLQMPKLGTFFVPKYKKILRVFNAGMKKGCFSSAISRNL